MSCTISLVKLPATVEAPISMVGFTRCTTSANRVPPLPSQDGRA